MYPEGSGSGVEVGVGVGVGVGLGVAVASAVAEVAGDTDVSGKESDVESEEQPAITPIPTTADEVRKSRLFTIPTGVCCSLRD
jgi:hypothetical protein